MDPQKAFSDEHRLAEPSSQDLIDRAAQSYRLRNDDEKSDVYWDPVWMLRRRADESVMDVAANLLRGSASADRILGADILVQIRIGAAAQGPKAARLLAAALEIEEDPLVLAAILFALGHTPDDCASNALVALQDHPSDSVRDALAALIKLTADKDEDIRDWATFGLGSLLHDDNDTIKEALAARLEDNHNETRGEAILGLAIRRDSRVVPAMLREIDANSPEDLRSWYLFSEAVKGVVQAATESGDPAWGPLLPKLKELMPQSIAAPPSAIDSRNRHSMWANPRCRKNGK